MKKFTQNEISKKYVTRSRFQQEVEKNNRLMKDIKLLVSEFTPKDGAAKIMLIASYRKALKHDASLHKAIARIAKEHFQNESRKKIKR